MKTELSHATFDILFRTRNPDFEHEETDDGLVYFSFESPHTIYNVLFKMRKLTVSRLIDDDNWDPWEW